MEFTKWVRMMILVKLLSTQQDFERLRCSKKLMIYVYSFYQNSENETPVVVLINEKEEPFLVINEPFDHEFLWDDHKFWRELDRLSINYDEDYSEELLKYYTQEKKIGDIKMITILNSQKSTIPLLVFIVRKTN
jgi:hypothetical protein